MPVPVADGHTHTNPVRGLGAEKIAGRFRESGGWFMALVALSPWAYGIDFQGVESYRRVVEDILVRECKAAEEQGVRVACIAGFHPADVDKLIDRYGFDAVEALETGLKVVETMEKYCVEGVLDGIGEVGRQHYKTTAERAVVAQLILERALQAARDHGCVVHMHLEQAGKATVKLVDLRVPPGTPPQAKARMIFHHSKPVMALEAARLGYSATLPGVPRLLDNVLGRVEPVFMLESDHIDDPMRPGVVVYPWVMAEHVRRLERRVGEEYLYKVNVDNVVRVYGVEPP